MPYAHPSPRTGTAQDLLRVVTRAYEIELEKNGLLLPEKTETSRRWVEPFFRLMGIAAAMVMETLPGDWNVAIHDRIYAMLSAPYSYAFEPSLAVVGRAHALAQALEKRTGRAPALLALLSHPPVTGELEHLNFELVRHATHLMRSVRGHPCRPRLVAATDPFALDATSIFGEGFYAGFVGTYHLGIDRLALGRDHLGTALTPQASWTAMPRRLFRVLSRGGEVGLVLSGGIPSTGRVLYGVRDWARRVRHESPHSVDPNEVEARLRADPSFQLFFRLARQAVEKISMPNGTWRVFDAWLMAACAGLFPGQDGEQAAVAALSALSIPTERREPLLEELRRDLTHETPTRRRLFRLLANRVGRRRPLLFLPVVHRLAPPGIEIREAWSMETENARRVVTRRADIPEKAEAMTADEFADRFVQENFA